MGNAAARTVAVVVGVVWATVLVLLIFVRSGNVSAPIHLGGRTVVPAEVPAKLVVQPPNQGYDGQFFYRQAVAPWSTAVRVNGVAMDATGLRAARIGYPTLVWALSLGRAGNVPVALLLVNVLAVAALAAVASAVATGLGRPWWFGLVYVVLPGVTFALALDLSDAVAVLCVVGALGACSLRRWPLCALWLSGAVLCRESTLAVVIALGVGLLITGLTGTADDPAPPNTSPDDAAGGVAPLAAARWFAVPLLIAGIWQVVVRLRWGEFGLAASGSSNITFPFSAIVQDRHLMEPTSGANLLRLLTLVLRDRRSGRRLVVCSRYPGMATNADRRVARGDDRRVRLPQPDHHVEPPQLRPFRHGTAGHGGLGCAGRRNPPGPRPIVLGSHWRRRTRRLGDLGHHAGIAPPDMVDRGRSHRSRRTLRRRMVAQRAGYMGGRCSGSATAARRPGGLSEPAPRRHCSHGDSQRHDRPGRIGRDGHRRR